MSKTETKNEPSSGKAGFGERTYEREVILHEENLGAIISEIAARDATFAVGNLVSFGTYPQASSTDDLTPMQAPSLALPSELQLSHWLSCNIPQSAFEADTPRGRLIQ